MIRVIALVLLAVLLVGCSVASPPTAVIKGAIALQLNQAQAQLQELLDPEMVEAPQTSIKRMTVKQREHLIIDGIAAYHVQGTYDLNLIFPDHQINQRDNPFDLYLQQNDAEETWFMVRPARNAAGQWERALIEF